MIAYLCNKCKKPIDLKKDYCAHLDIKWGENAIIDPRHRYGSGYSADLCEECYKSISKQIDCYYYSGNDYLNVGGTENGDTES